MNFMDVSVGLSIIDKGIRRIFLRISIFIHELITNLYEIFERLCKSRILDSDTLNSLSQRVGMLLAIIMLFIVSFSVIQMVLEPEKLTDKEKGIGNIAKKIILVIVMLGTSNFVFNALYSVQKTIIDSHIITKFLLPYEPDTEYFGGTLSAELFTTFFKAKDSSYEEDIKTIKEDIIYDNDFSHADDILNEGVFTAVIIKFGDYHIDFNWLFSPLLGLAALYFLFSYCITVGVRTIQLAFLEIISPMAIISYLSPKKDTMFEKWWKLYFSTYIDAFIRIMIINLAVFLISILLDDNMNFAFWNSVGKENNGSDTWIKIFMILALLTFAKKAPDLLKDLFPAGASKLGLGVTSPKQLFSNMLGGNLVESAVRMGTVGTAIGLSNAITSGVSRFKINKKNGKNNWQAALGAAGGVFSGFGRGFVAGNQKGNPFSTFSKGVKAQRDLNDKYDELVTSGGSTLGRMGAGLIANFGETPGQEYTRMIRNNEEVVKAYEAIDSQADKFSLVKTAKAKWENAIAGGADEADIEKYRLAYKAEKAKHITWALTGHDFGDAKENAVASQIKVNQSDISNLIKNGQVKLYDKNGKEIQYNGLIDSDTIDYASASANKQISDIKLKDDYNSAIANDRAAGVNSNGSGKS